MDNSCNKLFPSFSVFNDKKFSPGSCLIDSFSDQFSFHPHSLNIKKHIENLDNIVFRASSNSSFSIIIVTNFIQLVSPQPVDRFLQNKLRWKAPDESYSHICGMYKSNNK